MQELPCDVTHGLLQVDVAHGRNFFVHYIRSILCEASLEIELELVALFEEVAFVRKDRDYSVGDGRPRLNLLDPLEGVPETLGVSDVADDYECVLVSVELVQRALDVMTLGVELNR